MRNFFLLEHDVPPRIRPAYEFRTNDVHQDPLRVAMPPAPPLALQHRAAFDENARPLAERLALVRQVRTTAAQ